MSLLEGITGPAALRRLPADQLPALAQEIRTFLVESISRTGGHLGPNLGVVELTIALHRVFDSPRDAIVFDTGHQSYVHKLLTGRHDFSGLRTPRRHVGLPEPGRVRARRRRELARVVVAVVGRRHRQGPRAAGRDRPAHRGRHRRRRAHRRDGLGGAEQHRHRARPAAGRSSSTTTSAPTRRPSAAWPTTSRPCAPPAATSASSTGARARCSAAARPGGSRSRRCTA